MTYWGYHLILNCSKCVPHTIRSHANIETFSNELVKRIDMVAYGRPQIVHFGTGNKAGYTLIQLIETSNIAGHFVEETDDIYLDVFSCKPFEQDTVTQTVNQYFSPKVISSVFLNRQAGTRLFVENGNNYKTVELK
jgi:S-adenosylmethionine/arginine decarboxylase-like enzyme